MTKVTFISYPTIERPYKSSDLVLNGRYLIVAGKGQFTRKTYIYTYMNTCEF